MKMNARMFVSHSRWRQTLRAAYRTGTSVQCRALTFVTEHGFERSKRSLSSARPLPEQSIDYDDGDDYHALRYQSSPTARTEQNQNETRSPPQDLLLAYSPDTNVPITSRLHIVKPGEDTPSGVWPAFRLMEQTGDFRDPSYDGYDIPVRRNNRLFTGDRESPQALEQLRAFLVDVNHNQRHEIEQSGLLVPSPNPFVDTCSSNTLLRAHRLIIRLRQMDDILLNAQRQGRISFYMTCKGEEAVHMGAASALTIQDPILAQYREQGLLMWRGFTLEQFTNQCLSTDLDLGKGRQMPVHYGSKALNYHTISSPLGTQLPQAVGVAYRLKLEGKPNVAVCFFGDGCASTTDFHSAMNFAATLRAPVIFVCRNNGYAISTPTSEQYRGDGIVSRAPGYGMAAIRVDGNDVFAVHAAVREAKRYAIENSAPVLIEAMTYRLGHHSTSDDSSRYRSADEVQSCYSHFDPLHRLEAFLGKIGWMSSDESAALSQEERRAVLKAIDHAERRPRPSVDNLFTDVYLEMPQHLQRQKQELDEHLRKYPSKYA